MDLQEAYICEALIECVKNGSYIDLDDVKKNIATETIREVTIKALSEMGVK